MNTPQLLLRSVLYRKSQRSLAKEFGIPKTTLNRVLNGNGSIDEINSASLEDAYCSYPMPEGFSAESSVQVVIPFCLRKDQSQLMMNLSEAFKGTPYETSFRMQEIRKLIMEGADYSDGLIFINEETFKEAKAKLESFKCFKQEQGTIIPKYDFWIRHTREAINILETAYRGNFSTDVTTLKSSIELVFDLKSAVDLSKTGSDQKHALEFLLITSATQTAEIAYEGGYKELIPDLSNIIAKTFGKYAEASFKLLMVINAWSHNQEGMRNLLEQDTFNSNDESLNGKSLDARKQALLKSLTKLSGSKQLEAA